MNHYNQWFEYQLIGATMLFGYTTLSSVHVDQRPITEFSYMLLDKQYEKKVADPSQWSGNQMVGVRNIIFVAHLRTCVLC